MTQIRVDEKEMREIWQKISCYKCAHVRMCKWFEAFQQIVAVPEGSNVMHINAERLAEICPYYAPDLVAPPNPFT